MKNKYINLKKFYRLNIFLFTLNIAGLVAFSMISKTTTIDPQEKMNSQEFLKKELNLNQAQFDSISSLDKINFEHYQRILQRLCKNRNLLLKEVSKPNPDKKEIKRITLHIGHLHTGLKRQTVNHLLNIKKVCNEKQKEKLELLFEEILEVNKQCEHCEHTCELDKKNKP